MRTCRLRSPESHGWPSWCVALLANPAIELTKQGYNIKPEIMIPVVGILNEVKLLKGQIVKIVDELMKQNDIKKTTNTIVFIFLLPLSSNQDLSLVIHPNNNRNPISRKR